MLPCAMRIVTLLLVAATTALAEDRPIPDFLIICKRNDPNFQECLQKSVENLHPRLANGIPELNVPPMEPLYLREFLITDSGTLRVTGKGIKVYRTSEFVMSDFSADTETGDFKFHLDFPGLNVVGKYSIEGRILLLPVRGEGPVSLNITTPSADVTLRSTMVMRDGEEYLEFPSLDVKVVVPGGTIRLDNLFGGDKVLGDVINAAVNANFEQVLQELNRPIEKALEKNLLEIAQGVVKIFPARQLMPEN